MRSRFRWQCVHPLGLRGYVLYTYIKYIIIIIIIHLWIPTPSGHRLSAPASVKIMLPDPFNIENFGTCFPYICKEEEDLISSRMCVRLLNKQSTNINQASTVVASLLTVNVLSIVKVPLLTITI